MRKIRLFISGTHNNLTFSNEDIKAIHELSVANPNERIPFVLGHPKNDLPILGWIERGKVQLYEEGDKMAIGFDRKDAIFAEESIDVLKQMKNDKISIKLEDSVITHIGLVKKAAVKENNDQTFSIDNKTGVLCFSEDFAAEEPKEPFEDRVVKIFNQLFNKSQNQIDMTPEQLKAENEALKLKVEAFEAKEKEATQNKEVEDLKNKVAAFEAKEVAAKKTALKNQVEALKLDEQKTKDTIAFGENLLEKSPELFDEWHKQLPAAPAAPKVQNGSVVYKEFAAGAGSEKKTLDDAVADQFNSLNS